MFRVQIHLVGVAVARGSPVLQISVALLRHVTGDADAAAPAWSHGVMVRPLCVHQGGHSPVGHPGAKVVNTRGFVLASQTSLVILEKYNWLIQKIKIRVQVRL